MRADADAQLPAPSLVSPAQFPRVKASAGHYESFYLKACHPEGGLGVWIRYTVHKRPRDEQVKGFVWFTLFDRAGGPLASKAQFADPRAGAEHYISMGQDCRFAPGHITGRAPSEQLDAAWELQFDGTEPAVWHLPGRWMYRTPVPRTKVLSPHPEVLVRGWIEAGPRRIDVSGWPGTVGHNWGTEHARRAIWLHGTNFEGGRGAWLDVAVARVGLGPLTTPWLATGELCLDGRRHRLGGLGRVRATRIEESVERCRFRLAGEDVSIEGTAGARRQDFVAWIYAQPSGQERQTINCSIADLRLDVSRAALPPVTLAVHGGAAYELQSDERHPEVPVQPFPDG